MSKKIQKKTARPGSSGKTAARSSPKTKVPILAEGDRAPSFTLPAAGGGKVSLADFAGQNLVLFFYPRAGTPGCTTEASDFSRLSGKFDASDTAILGVSADPIQTVEAFQKKHLLKIPLATDEPHSSLQKYGVWAKKSMYGKTFDGIVRTTFLIGKTGKILKVWEKVKVPGHAEDVLSSAEALAR
ncbi:MAG: peroxiredoxin [Bradyrhizobiaceae bacterium]|nr:MAG: peroxiredoxin [Bradyrhizobiaceae bacterium]